MARPAATIGKVATDSGGTCIDVKLWVQPDADVAEVVICLAGTGFRHRHLGAQRGRIVTELTQVVGQRGGYRRQHTDRDGRTGQLAAIPDHGADAAYAVRPRVAAQ